MLGVTYLEPDDLRRAIRTTQHFTDRPFGVNLILEWDQRARLSICLEEGVRIISYHWSTVPLESDYVTEPHEADALVMHTIGSAEEGRRAAETGVDVVVAQGLDAGGHVWGSVGTMALVPTVV
jgi:NAD(P)H-dependent flavin oxidoreductase YrpB (nitropropane dioxygenase family)